MNAPVKRAVLSSGSLYLSPPLPDEKGSALVQNLEKALEESHQPTLESASPAAITSALQKLQVNSMWLQMTPELDGWQNRMGQATSLLVGDVEYEVKLTFVVRRYDADLSDSR